MHVVLGAVPSGKEVVGDHRCGHVPTRFVSVAGRATRTTPSPDPTWRAAGALFSCSLHLQYLVRGSAHHQHPLGCRRIWGQEARDLQASELHPLTTHHLHHSLSFSLSADWPVKRRSPPASHHVAAQSRRHWFQRLSVKAHGPLPLPRCDTVPDGLACTRARQSLPSHKPPTHTHTYMYIHTR